MSDEIVIGSILQDVKKLLGLAPDYDPFDVDIMIYINSAFMTLAQLNLGPPSGFSITGPDETWQDFLEGETQTNLEGLKSYVVLSVRLIWDPPATSFVLTALENQKKELEWRLNIQAEAVNE